MKTSLIFFLSILTVGIISPLTSHAKVMKSGSFTSAEVVGSLNIQNQGDFQASLTTRKGDEIKLQNIHLPWSSCRLGEFVIEPLAAGELSNEAGWFLVDIIECYDDRFSPEKYDDKEFCPEVYEPVCAQPKMRQCSPGMGCIQVMPLPRTYSNVCQMWLDGSDFIDFGTCEEKSALSHY